MQNNAPVRPNDQACSAAQGKLPACAPLANPYVPFQGSKPTQYQPEKALVRGTLFPGLDLPFMGMVNDKEKSRTPLHQIQSLSFAMTELGEYLDTHADDTEAVELFNAYSELYGELMADYENSVGPMTQREAGESGRWNWTKAPWPWELAANGEV